MMTLHPTNNHTTQGKSPPQTFVAKTADDMNIFMQIVSDYPNPFALDAPFVDTDLRIAEKPYATGVEEPDT